MKTPDPVRIADYKAQAKRLRASLNQSAGTALTHAQALELVAHQHGARDWNTLRARNGPPRAADLSVGATVRGRYLGQDFSGRVLGLAEVGGGRYRVTLHFDAPVDVVTFESFSAFRQRVSCVVGPEGHSPARTSDGRPHLILDAVG
jgi:hypothetical protein